MSWIDRLIERVVARLPSRRGPTLVVVDAEGLLVADETGERRYRWEDVERVAATSSADLVGETMLVVLSFTDGRGIIVPETDPHWSALVDDLAVRLPGTEPSAGWRLRLIAEPEQALDIYRRR